MAFLPEVPIPRLVDVFRGVDRVGEQILRRLVVVLEDTPGADLGVGLEGDRETCLEVAEVVLF